MGWEYRIFFRHHSSVAGNIVEDQEDDFDASMTRTATTTSSSILDKMRKEMNLFSYIHEDNPRTDVYIPHSRNVGIKYRGGIVAQTEANCSDDALNMAQNEYLEVKLCSHRKEDSGFELWTKHTISGSIRQKTGGRKDELKKFLQINGQDPNHLDKDSSEMIAVHKERIWAETRNGVFVEETRLSVRRHESEKAQISSKGWVDTAEVGQTEHWTTVSVEGNNAQSGAEVKELIREVCQSHSGGKVIFECGYPEFIVDVAFCQKPS